MKLYLFSLLFLVFLSCDKKEMKISDGLNAINRNKSIGTGINLGNALEAPNEGDWGLIIEERFIDSIRQAGFNSVRIPICWSCHTDSSYPYKIDEAFLARVDQVVEWCIEKNLVAIITIHHFNELYDLPENTTYRNMFFSIWAQLTEHYRQIDCDKLIFEPLNEPHNYLTADKWNQLIPEILQVIRSVDTSRTLIIDTPDYGYHQSITRLVISENEQNIIISVRYYLPYEFTHQGAHWAEGSEGWLGNTWTGTASQKNTVIADMDFIKKWAEENNRPVTVGEWGSIIYCDHESRLSWTEFVRRQIEEHGFSSTYFDFGVFFRAYDLENDHWLDGFKAALLAD
jgi:endoglucanase